jgi:hypothetical protein
MATVESSAGHSRRLREAANKQLAAIGQLKHKWVHRDEQPYGGVAFARDDRRSLSLTNELRSLSLTNENWSEDHG